MRVRPFGTNGPTVPIIGQGTWELERFERRAVERALLAGVDAGMTHIDTAEMYGSGRVEELVGAVLGRRRDELFLVSKILPENATRAGTVQACERSLRRLRTDHLDAYLLHWIGPHPLEETVEGFEALVRDGKIRRWGVSNFDETKLAELETIAPPERIACNQVLCHLEERTIEHEVLPHCRQRGVAVVMYSPFGSGKFPPPESDGRRLLEAIGERYGATAHQVALAFLLRDEGTFTIPRSADPDHARQNAAAADIDLQPGDIERIDRAFPRGPWHGGVPVI